MGGLFGGGGGGDGGASNMAGAQFLATQQAQQAEDQRYQYQLQQQKLTQDNADQQAALEQTQTQQAADKAASDAAALTNSQAKAAQETGDTQINYSDAWKNSQDQLDSGSGLPGFSVLQNKLALQQALARQKPSTTTSPTGYQGQGNSLVNASGANTVTLGGQTFKA